MAPAGRRIPRPRRRPETACLRREMRAVEAWRVADLARRLVPEERRGWSLGGSGVVREQFLSPYGGIWRGASTPTLTCSPIRAVQPPVVRLPASGLSMADGATTTPTHLPLRRRQPRLDLVGQASVAPLERVAVALVERTPPDTWGRVPRFARVPPVRFGMRSWYTRSQPPSDAARPTGKVKSFFIARTVDR